MRNWQIAAQIFHRALAPIPSIGRQYAVDSCSLHSEPMLLRTCSKIGSAIEEICLAYAQEPTGEKGSLDAIINSSAIYRSKT
jgi:hypothetical protein